jgi:uncharacterized protein YcbX
MVGIQSGVNLSLENLGVICGIVAALLAMATAYLRLFTANAIKDLRASLVNDAAMLRATLVAEGEKTYARRELIDIEIIELKRRVHALEREQE